MKTKNIFLGSMLFGMMSFGTSCGGDLNVPEKNEDHFMHSHQSKDASEMQEATGKVFFTNVKTGDTLTNPVALVYGVEGMEVHPAGEIIEGTGHHHLLIGLDSVPAGQVVPADKNHIHYGGGQIADTLDLPSGNVKLSLQFADGMHASYGNKMSHTIEVFVK
ncbi:MAG: DUF4399 domain-containing protein [Bacteroidia bacterium]